MQYFPTFHSIIVVVVCLMCIWVPFFSWASVVSVFLDCGKCHTPGTADRQLKINIESVVHIHVEVD